MDPVAHEFGRIWDWVAGLVFLLVTTIMGFMTRANRELKARVDEMEDGHTEHGTAIALIKQHDRNELCKRIAEAEAHASQRTELLAIVDKNHTEVNGKLDRLIDRFLEGS